MNRALLVGIGTVLLLGLGAFLNPTVYDWLSLEVLSLTTGLELVHVKTFADDPKRVFVPKTALKSDQSGRQGAVYIVRGSALSHAKEFSLRVELGEVRGDYTEVKSSEVLPTDLVVIFAHASR